MERLGSRRAYFVGEPPHALRAAVPDLRVLQPPVAYRATAATPWGVVLALDDLGMARLRADALAARIREPYTVVLLSPRDPCASWLYPWRDAGLGEIVPPVHLVDRFVDLLRTPVLPLAPAEEWEPAALRDAVRARSLLHAIPAIARPKVAEWAEDLGVHERTLHSRCHACFALSPADVLWARTDAMVARERGAGVDAEVVAAVAGYSDWNALARAYRRRGRPVPKPVRPPAQDPIRPYRDSDPAVASPAVHRHSGPPWWKTELPDDRASGSPGRLTADPGRGRRRTDAARP